MSVKGSEKKHPLYGIMMCDTVLPHLNNVALSVHSVFHHACNLTTPGNHLLTLLTQDSPLAPGAVRVNCEDFRPIFSVGETLTRQGDGEFVTAECRMVWADALRQSTRVADNARLPDRLMHELHIFLPVTAPDYGIWNVLHSSDERLRQSVQQLTAWLDDAPGLPDDMLKKLIGAGAGLTPSGDDFLLGMLFMLRVAQHHRFQALATGIRTYLDRTTDISRAMLEYGCRGHFGEPLLALAQPMPPSLNARLLRVADYGHSSGHDMLTGLFFTLRALSGQRL